MKPMEITHDLQCGKMFPEHSRPTKEKISASSSKNCVKSKNQPFLFLDLRGGRKRWEKAGSIVADEWSIAWRTLDAQYWGVPQRRRRIHLVADFRGQCAEKVLFERESLQRSFAESRKAWHGIANNNTLSAHHSRKRDGRGTSGNESTNIAIALDNHPNDSRVTISKDGKVQTLTSRMGTGGGNIPLIIARTTQRGNVEYIKNKYPTMTAATGTSGNNQPVICYGVDTFNQCLTGDKAKTCLAGHIDADGVPCIIILDDQNDRIIRTDIEGKTSPTLRAEMNNYPPCIAINLLQDAVPNEKVSPCISTGNPNTGQATIAVCYSIDRASFNQGKNAKYKMGIDKKGSAHTLVSQGPGAVCYCIGINGDKAGTIDSHYYLGCGNRGGKEREIIVQLLKDKLIIRRLTPKECGRLQGMPDWWCSDVEHCDTSEYKMWGNGMALPDLMYVIEGMSIELCREHLNKLFGGTHGNT